MPNGLDRYIAATSLKYYLLFALLLALPMLPLLRTLSSSYGYLLTVLSIVASSTACATLLEFGFRRELTTLQRYGVEYAQVFRPLMYATIAPIVTVAALAVVVAANRGAAVCWSALNLCCATLCVRAACKRSWDNAASGRSGIMR